jgi:hypothetical protein
LRLGVPVREFFSLLKCCSCMSLMCSAIQPTLNYTSLVTLSPNIE